MNRLWVRLTVAFVAVTLVGAGTVALLVDWQAGNQFRQYLAQQDNIAQSGLLEELAAFYQPAGNWDGVAVVFADFVMPRGSGQGMGGAGRGRPPFILADANGFVVYDERGERVGGELTGEERASALLVGVDGNTVGYLVLGASGQGAGALAPAEQSFLDQLRLTLVIAALAAGGLGILLGVAISWSLAAPLAKVAQAARAFAGRKWDQRVSLSGVATQEVADVARAFNDMADSLQRAEALRRNLMADIAHELRTPLTVLQGNLRALLDGVYPLELGEIATLYDETRLLNRLVDDLRELSLAEAGQLRLNLQATDVRALLQAATASFAPVAEAQGASLAVEVNDGLPLVNTDPDRLAQVVRNLLSNALRHTPGGGKVVLSASAEKKMIRVVVADTGDGIPADELPHVFDRFYRGDKSRARASGGSGLGLAIAKTWVAAMGGEIGVESEPGRGSRFWCTVPAVR